MYSRIQLKKYHWFLVVSFWLLVQMVLLYNNGIITNGEAEKYTSIADTVAAGNWRTVSINYYLYAGYVLILVLLKLVGLSYHWMYLVQLIIAFISFTCFVKLLTVQLSAVTAVFIAAILFAICPVYQPWNCFLYTDPMFTHLLIITIYLLTFPFIKPPIRSLTICLLVLPFFRPVGFLFIPVALYYWLKNKPANYRGYIFSFSVYFIVLAVFSWYSITHAADFFYPNHNSEANIICGYPAPLVKYISHPYHPGESMFHFFMANPSMTWRLFAERLYKTFWMTRPYFSNNHNLLLILSLLIYYSLAIMGMYRIFFKKTSHNNYWLFMGLFIFSLPMMVFCADWSNRFVLPAFIFVLFFMALGVDWVIGRFTKEKVRTNL